MAKYKVLKTFRDKHTGVVYSPNSEIEMTVKRADEVEKNLDSSFLERIDISSTDDKQQVTEDGSKDEQK